MNSFYKLKVLECQKDTQNAVRILLDVPATIQDQFKFKQGQYLNLKFNFGNEEQRRSYSICNAPSENASFLEILVKETENGFISKYLNSDLKVEDEIEVMPPLGSFNTIYHVNNEKTYVGLAAGSGISPVLSNLKVVCLVLIAVIYRN